MKNVFYLLLVSLLICSLGACSDDDNKEDNVQDSITLTIKATCYSDADQKNIPDVGSIVYLFEGFSYYNGGDWKYNGEGSFSSEKWGTRWTYTKKATIGKDGSIIINNVQCPEGYKYFSIAIDSEYNKNVKEKFYGVGVFNFENKDIKLNYSYGSGIFREQ